MNAPHDPIHAAPQLASATMVHAAMRFLALLRRSKAILFVTLAASMLLGAMYFGTAARIYQSRAQVYVTHFSPNSDEVQLNAGKSTIEQMATYQRLFTSAVVLESAMKQLDELPPEVDTTATPERQIVQMRDLIRANTLRRTSIIEISCCSESPAAAMKAVDSVVAAYIDYIDSNHRSVTAEVITELRADKQRLQAELVGSEQRMREVSRRTHDFTQGDGTNFVHPAVQTVVKLNEELSSVHQRRITVQASLTSFRQAVNSGGDLRQHLVGLEPLMGKELLMNAVGINTDEAAAMAATEQRISEAQIELRNASKYYLENHPKITSLVEEIKGRQQYVASLNNRVNSRLSGLHNEQLASMITNLLEEDLARTWEQEKQLSHAYQVAERKAVAYKDSLAEKDMAVREHERLQQTYSDLSDRLATLEINDGQNDVRASVVSHASMPQDPISPLIVNVGLLSALAGLTLGALIVYIRDTMDDRFRSPEELQDQLGAAVLAMVRKHDSRPGVGLETLQVKQSPDAVESEAFRTLRTTLAFSGEDYRRLVVTSSEPSDGKTTVLANLGCSYAQAGRRTLLIDCDLRKPGLTTLFDLRRQEGVSDILRSGEDIGTMCKQRLHQTGMETLDVLPSGRRMSDSAEMLSQNRFAELLAWAEMEYDQVLVDSPPILAAADAAIIGRLVDGVLVVVRPDKNHRRLVTRAVQGLTGFDVNVLGIVVNAVSEEHGADYYGYGGYGYGYGYGYGAGYGEEESETEAHEQRPASVSIGSSANEDGGSWLKKKAA